MLRIESEAFKQAWTPRPDWRALGERENTCRRQLATAVPVCCVRSLPSADNGAPFSRQWPAMAGCRSRWPSSAARTAEPSRRTAGSVAPNAGGRAPPRHAAAVLHGRVMLIVRFWGGAQGAQGDRGELVGCRHKALRRAGRGEELHLPCVSTVTPPSPCVPTAVAAETAPLPRDPSGPGGSRAGGGGGGAAGRSGLGLGAGPPHLIVVSLHSTAFPCCFTAFHCLSLLFHCIPLPFLGLPLHSTAFPWPSTAFPWPPTALLSHCLSLTFFPLTFAPRADGRGRGGGDRGPPALERPAARVSQEAGPLPFLTALLHCPFLDISLPFLDVSLPSLTFRCISLACSLACPLTVPPLARRGLRRRAGRARRRPRRRC